MSDSIWTESKVLSQTAQRITRFWVRKFTPDEARAFALNVLDAAAAAEHDAVILDDDGGSVNPDPVASLRAVRGKSLRLDLGMALALVEPHARPYVAITVAGATPRASRVDVLGGFLTSEEGLSHAELLRQVADLLDAARAAEQ